MRPACTHASLTRQSSRCKGKPPPWRPVYPSSESADTLVSFACKNTDDSGGGKTRINAGSPLIHARDMRAASVPCPPRFFPFRRFPPTLPPVFSAVSLTRHPCLVQIHVDFSLRRTNRHRSLSVDSASFHFLLESRVPSGFTLSDVSRCFGRPRLKWFARGVRLTGQTGKILSPV